MFDWVAGPLLILGAIGSVAAVVVRYRRADGDDRQQIALLAWVAATAIVILILGLSLQSVFPVVGSIGFTALFAVIGIGVPLAIQNAVIRHRLYDLDVVIKKTVVFAIVVVLLVGIGGIVAVLVGVGIVPSLYDSPPLMLFLGLAYGLMVTPAYRLASRIADRVVYGGRASPSEVLSEFSERLSETYATDDVLPRMAAIVGDATRAKEVRVWLRVGGVYRVAASWPADLLPEDPVDDPGEVVPRFPGEGHRTEVRDRGELLGAITTSFHANDPIDPARERLIRDMAAQAGLVLRNVGLIENLRASRQRMVAAQDEGRRRLERNIHDGAQQQLVALSVKTRLADSLIDRDTAKAHEMLAQIQADTNDALETLRDLARGIYPPLLADKGLAVALAAQGRKVTVPVSLDADGIGRYPAEAEATVYFCVLEAIQNVSKYAQASGIELRLSASNGSLTFEVRDDGVGFDPQTHTPGTGIQGMQDRLGRRRRLAAGGLDARRGHRRHRIRADLDPVASRRGTRETVPPSRVTVRRNTRRETERCIDGPYRELASLSPCMVGAIGPAALTGFRADERTFSLRGSSAGACGESRSRARIVASRGPARGVPQRPERRDASVGGTRLRPAAPGRAGGDDGAAPLARSRPPTMSTS